jgi:hypothetical protein
MESTHLISQDFDALLLDIHSKHLFNVSISNRFVPFSDVQPSYSPSQASQQRLEQEHTRLQLTNNSDTA